MTASEPCHELLCCVHDAGHIICLRWSGAAILFIALVSFRAGFARFSHGAVGPIVAQAAAQGPITLAIVIPRALRAAWVSPGLEGAFRGSPKSRKKRLSLAAGRVAGAVLLCPCDRKDNKN